MGLWDIAKEQFLDVIEFEDKSNKLIVTKYRRENGDDELKQGSKVIVRESQCAVFLKGGKLADVLLPGTYTLDTENFPILTKLKAFPYLFVSPVIADLYFVSMRQFIDNKWDTKTAIIKKDQNLNIVRIQAFGKFTFRISDVTLFMKEIFGTRGIVMTYDIVEYLSSMVTETFSGIVGETTESIVDLAAGYSKMAAVIQKRLNSKSEALGIQYSNVVIEGILLPEEVEEFIDEQAGLSMAQNNMENFVQYQTARAMRDVVKDQGGWAGIGAEIVLANTMAQNVQKMTSSMECEKSRIEKLRELKELLDEGILTQEEFCAEKKRVLEK